MRKLGIRSWFLVLLAAASLAAAEEWPQWRGPLRDGIVREADLLQDWPPAGPNRLWSRPVGRGYSSPVAVDGLVYLDALDGDRDVLRALNAETGQTVWEQARPAARRRDYQGTRATPLVDGDRIYTFTSGGVLACWDRTTGTPAWSLDILAASGTKRFDWDPASSPTLDGDVLYVQTGEGGPIAVAVDKRTGQVLWQSQFAGKAGYAPVVVADAGGQKVLLVFANDRLVGMDAAGRTLWEVPHPTQYGVNAATPVVRGDRAFITSGYGQGSRMVRFDARSAEVLWHQQQVGSRTATPILDGDVLYVNSEGTLACINWSDGQVRWSTRDASLGSGGMLVRFGDRLIAYGENGQLTLLQATPDAFRILATFKAFGGGENWATPLVYNGRLYVKGPEELACYEIRAK